MSSKHLPGLRRMTNLRQVYSLASRRNARIRRTSSWSWSQTLARPMWTRTSTGSMWPVTLVTTSTASGNHDDDYKITATDTHTHAHGSIISLWNQLRVVELPTPTDLSCRVAETPMSSVSCCSHVERGLTEGRRQVMSGRKLWWCIWTAMWRTSDLVSWSVRREPPNVTKQRILSVNWRHITDLVSSKGKTKEVYCCFDRSILMFLMREGLQSRISILKHCLMRLWIDINQMTFVFPVPKMGQLTSVDRENAASD